MNDETDQKIAQALKAIEKEHKNEFYVGDGISYLGQGLVQIRGSRQDAAILPYVKKSIQSIDYRLVITAIISNVEGMLVNFDRFT